VLTNPWARFLARRLLGLLGVLVLLVITLFWAFQLIPGDPVRNSLGLDADPATIQRLRHDNGFDKPLLEQFTRYLGHVVQGDLGRSFVTKEAVTQIIKERASKSAELAGAALVLVLVVAIPLGMLAAAATREGRHRKFELAFMSTTSILGSVPELLKATVLAFVFGVYFRLLPVAGSGSFSYLVLPVLAISIAPIMTLSRIVRVETLNVLAQDYIRTARGKRLPGRLIFFRHVLPNVLTAVLTIGGLLFATLMGGAVIVENIFARQGLGQALVVAVNNKEYVIVQGVVLMLGAVLVVVNTIVDIVLGLLDPRSLARHA
jgi:peptide/nickel transport system permease protein